MEMAGKGASTYNVTLSRGGGGGRGFVTPFVHNKGIPRKSVT